MKIVNYTGSDIERLKNIETEFAAGVFLNMQHSTVLLNTANAIEPHSSETLNPAQIREESDLYHRAAIMHYHQLGRLIGFIVSLKAQKELAAVGIKLEGFIVENIVITDDGVFAVDAEGFKECGKRPTPCDEYCTCDEYSKLEALDV